MKDEPTDDLPEMIQQAFDLQLDGHEDHQRLINILAERIASLLETDMEAFMSMLYRLDVSETKIRAALSPDNEEPPNVTLAKLIIARQMQRMQTKVTYKSTPLKDWWDF